MEKWMSIPDHSEYEVSDSGRIRRAVAGRKTYIGKVLADHRVSSGYRKVSLTKAGKVLQRYVHRLVMAAFVGPAPDGHEVNHIDGDKANNALANLEYVTRSENMRHAIRVGLVLTGEDSPVWRGGPKPQPKKPKQIGDNHWVRKMPERIARGENSGKNKVTSDQVAAIRSRALAGTMQKSLAAEYGLSRAQICRIIKGSRWA